MVNSYVLVVNIYATMVNCGVIDWLVNLNVNWNVTIINSYGFVVNMYDALVYGKVDIVNRYDLVVNSYDVVVNSYDLAVNIYVTMVNGCNSLTSELQC